MDKDELKENFPTLYKELTNDGGKGELSSSEIKSLINDKTHEESNSEESAEPLIPVPTKLKEKDYLQGFDPKAVDFIRRAKTESEALEIILYLQDRNEITEEESTELKNKLSNQGLESFGDHKTDGYYFEFQRRKHLQEKLNLSGKQPLKK